MCSSLCKIIILLFTVASLGWPASAHAQVDFREGYIITSTPDTFKGQIAYCGDRRNAEACVFRCGPEFEKKEYKPFEIMAYRFNDDRYYISKSFELDGNRYNLFLEYLVDGIENLYYFKDHEGRHYLLEKEGRDPVIISKELFRIKYSELLAHKDSCIRYRITPPQIRFIFAAHTGIIFSQLQLEGNSIYAGIDIENYEHMTFGVGFGMQFPGMSERFEFLMSSEYGNVYYTGTIDNFTETEKLRYHLYISSGIWKNSLSARYLFPTGRIQPIVEIGGIYQRLLSPQSYGLVKVYTEEGLSMEIINLVTVPKNSLGYRTGTGVNFKSAKRLQVLLQVGFEYTHGIASNNSIINKTFDFYFRAGIKMHLPATPYPYSYNPPDLHPMPPRIY